MKKIYNYILLSVWALASVCCSDEELVEKQPTGKSGDEVQFGLSLPDFSSRTVYGDETDVKDESGNVTGKVFPIYWVDGDKVQVFSPQCLTGRRNAEYKVILPTGIENPNYAENLEKTGEYGVQWGEADYATFYSLYPSGNYTLSSDGTKAENIVINYQQNIKIQTDGSVKSDMEDCLMYAKNDGGADNNYQGVAKGEVVNLRYNPISTVIYVTLEVAKNSENTAEETFIIQSVKLIAPEGTDIAGTFSLNIADGSFGVFADGKSSNVVSAAISDVSTGGYLNLKNEGKVSLPLFIAPISNLNVKNWQIQVVANNVAYTKTLNIDKVLEPGQIHKVVLPKLAETTTEWDVANWMVNIPRNVYLSEISIPGSWNTLNSEYQTENNISEQYSVGTRAFHFDTRWRSTDSSISMGYLDNNIDSLSVAIGSDYSAKLSGVSGNNRAVKSTVKSFYNYLNDITAKVQPDEYMVLICTFAQDSYDYTDSNGNNWASAISDACKNNSFVYDGKKLTKNTLVGDVLGSVIVIVNTEGDITSIPTDSKCLFVNMPMTLTSDLFGSSLTEKNSGPISIYGNSEATVKDSEIDMYNTHAQICIADDDATSLENDRSDVNDRGFAPSISERKTVATNILDWSKSNYNSANYDHDKWIYLGLGGYYVAYDEGVWGLGAGWDEVNGSNSTVASVLNSWIDGKVTEMGTTPTGSTTVVPYYPVGIVLMNYVNNYSDEVKNILILNNKYTLKYDATKPVNYNPNAAAATSYDATATSGGNVISLD